MENIIDLLLGNEVLLIATVCVIVALIFFIIKKMMKLTFYALGILIALLAYLYYTGESVTTLIEPAKETIEKAEEKVEQSKKEAEQIKNKVETELKK